MKRLRPPIIASLLTAAGLAVLLSIASGARALAAAPTTSASPAAVPAASAASTPTTVAAAPGAATAPLTAAPAPAAVPVGARRTILFFGDSLTAGYGLDPDQAFPALIQQKLDAAGLAYRAVNAGLSGDTSAGGLRRVDWLLRQKVDVFVLELGGNDGLRGVPVAQTRENLRGIIAKVRAKNPATTIVLAGMQIPPNMGETYTREFRDVFTTIAQETGAALIPFLLEGVGGDPKLNLPDGIHPTARGHEIVAETVWSVLQPVL